MKHKEYKGPERRRYLRLDEKCVVKYVKLSQDLKLVSDSVNDAYSKDISAGGILFVSREEISVPTILELQIKIPTVEHFIVAIGKTVRCIKNLRGRFEIGVAFIWIKDKDMVLIDSYVRQREVEKLEKKIKRASWLKNFFKIWILYFKGLYSASGGE